MLPGGRSCGCGSDQQVDAPRWQAELDDGAGSEQILPGHGKSFDRRAKLAQRSHARSAFASVDSIQTSRFPVARGTRCTAIACAPTTIERAGVVQGDQRIAEVVVQLTESPPAGRMTRVGIRSRGCSGMARPANDQASHARSHIIARRSSVVVVADRSGPGASSRRNLRTGHRARAVRRASLAESVRLSPESGGAGARSTEASDTLHERSDYGGTIVLWQSGCNTRVGETTGRSP